MYTCDCCSKEIVNEYDAFYLGYDTIILCEECYNIETEKAMEVDDELDELAECVENMEID
jgi:hypothetical protein